MNRLTSAAVRVLVGFVGVVAVGAGPAWGAQTGEGSAVGDGAGSGGVERAAWPVFTPGPDYAAASVAVLDPDALAAARQHRGRLMIEGFPLGLGRSVDLVVEPFRVVSPAAEFVVGRMDGPDEAMDFDPGSIAFWRGRVAGFPGSHVFISVAEASTFGRIELGAGRPTYVVSSRGGDPAAGGVELAPGQVAVFRGRGGPGHWTVPTLCGTDTAGFEAVGAGPENPPMIRGLRMAELAVDSDYAFYRLFDDEQAAATYLVQVYGVVSDIFVRDVKVRLDLVFLRVWTTANNPYQSGSLWPVIPPEVRYQVAQVMSGRKDASAGGMAYICAAPSWVAYALGFFTDPTTPNVFNQDMRIAAHEIGHNLGAPHTHDIGIDQCHIATSPPRRGTIMSYCTQTFSGGSALTEMRLHTGIQQRIFNCIPRLPFDCNQNHLNDADDIASGRSPDVNANNIPDECEDCNNNGIIDEYDIASGFSLDVNENGIPDECEPDCNNNQIPDEMDIRMGWSQDANGNGIPDECEADCDGNGIPDFLDIFNDMSLDLDRDGVLDQCQDCDGNGVPDIVALDHANNVWAVSSGDGLLKEYHQQTGVHRADAGQGVLSNPVDVLITPDKRVLATSRDVLGAGRVVEFDHRGEYVRDLVPLYSGRLTYPTALALGPDRSLLVASGDRNSILQYHLDTGDPMGHFVQPGAGGLAAPYGLAFGPNENLYVSTDDGRVLEFDGQTGAFVREFVQQGAGGLVRPRGVLFIPGPTPGAGPRFIVAGLGNNAVLEFDAESGAFIGQFNNGDYRGKLRGPWALRLGPDGNVYVSSSRLSEAPDPPALHLTDPHIFIFDGRNGNLLRAYVQGRDSLLANPKGFGFVPGHDRDCNLNHIPDWCDIASGRSLDRNSNGIPDECEDLCYADCDGDGVLDFLDFLCFQNAFLAADPYADCDGNGRLDFFDFLCFQNEFVGGCP